MSFLSMVRMLSIATIRVIMCSSSLLDEALVVSVVSATSIPLSVVEVESLSSDDMM